jgi:hypothetical protein
LSDRPVCPHGLRQAGVREFDDRRLHRGVLGDHAAERVELRDAHPRVIRVLPGPMQHVHGVEVLERAVAAVEAVALRGKQRPASDLDHVRRHPVDVHLEAGRGLKQRVGVVEKQEVLE